MDLKAEYSLTWSMPSSPGLCKNQRTAAWGDLGRHSRKVLLCSVPKTLITSPEDSSVERARSDQLGNSGTQALRATN